MRSVLDINESARLSFDAMRQRTKYVGRLILYNKDYSAVVFADKM